jgi:hypothetical protein
VAAAFDWRGFLERWSAEWLRVAGYRAELPADVVASGWLGYPGATEAEIAALEAHLGIGLPPSYRAFLRVSNGWRATSPFISRLWSTEEVEWLAVRNQGLIDVYAEYPADEMWESRYLRTALEVSDWGDAAIYLLNPWVVRADGEWEAAFFANWDPEARPFGSFQEMMEAQHATFLDLRAQDLT